MGKFNGVLTHQTVSPDDFYKMMTMPAEEIKDWSNVGVKIVENTSTLYIEMARSIADVIVKNNKENKSSKIILPVGPRPQYKILAKIINDENINLSKLWIFFMDEYLDWESRLVPETHPMSFRGYMKKSLFNLIDRSLGLDNEHIVFPDPANLDYNDDMIEKLGGIDTCYGGLGYHGHIAFNEPYDTYFRRMTIEQYINSKTRILDLNADTFVINSLSDTGGSCYDVPPRAVTIGMKSIMNSKKIEIYCDNGGAKWQLASFRLAAMHPPTLDRPGTLLQLHPAPRESVLLVADKVTARPIVPVS
jgi:glucosamine-6-phosphate deaminase